MSSHPDADGFIRAILRRPADPTPRLVFADWLDETGRPGNAAWATYLRLRAEMNALPDDDPRFAELRTEAREVGERVIARLRLPAATFVADAAAWVQVLPPANFRLSLEGYESPTRVLEAASRAVAEDFVAVPIALMGNVLVWAVAHPFSGETETQFRLVFNREMLFVPADPTDVVMAIDRARWPDQGDGETFGYLDTLFTRAGIEQAELIAFLPRPTDVQVGIRAGERWIE
jgi:uncharacterized protein (TIGR02996 family)